MITFSSQVGPNIMMFDQDAYRLMELMGKKTPVRGVVTLEKIPEAVAHLHTALDNHKDLPGSSASLAIHRDETSDANWTMHEKFTLESGCGAPTYINMGNGCKVIQGRPN